MKDTFEFYWQVRRELSLWLEQSARMDGPGRNGGGEDEANYSLAWFSHYLISGEEGIVDHLKGLLAALAGWVERECHHGYEPEAEAHHGTEPFLLFLPRYLQLFPQDRTAKGLLEDAAHHIGNWVEGVPPWYDWQRDCFYSYRIGSRLVDDDPGFAYELAEHFRFIHIALAAHRVLQEGPYLEWALRYGRQRAERILAAGEGPLPLLWDLNGKGLLAADLQTAPQRRMAAANHHVDGDPLAGIENMLASGAVQALGDLFLLSGDEIFRDGARRLVAPLVDQLLDPYADPAAAALSHYRWIFADNSLDEQILAAVETFPEANLDELAMVFPQARRRLEPGVGKRNDMIYWGYWGANGVVKPITEPSSAALTLAYQLTGEVEYAQRALKGAATKLTMARRVLRGGREHADMGGAVCSVAAGHGRNWGTGAVTGCYGPLLLGTREICGGVVPSLEIRQGDGGMGLPADLLVLVRPRLGATVEVVWYNGGQQEIVFEWRPEPGPWQRQRLAPGQTRTI